MKYPKEYLDEIKTRLKVSTVVSKTVALKKNHIEKRNISKIGANSLKDMGKVMGELKKLHSDEIDFAKAGPLIKELLNN